MSTKMQPQDDLVKIHSLPKERLARYMRRLAKYPWITFIFVDGEVQIYVKSDVDDEHLAQLNEVLSEIA